MKQPALKSTAQFQVLGQKGAIHELTPSDWQVGKTGTERERMMLELQSPSYETLTGGGRKKKNFVDINHMSHH